DRLILRPIDVRVRMAAGRLLRDQCDREWLALELPVGGGDERCGKQWRRGTRIGDAKGSVPGQDAHRQRLDRGVVHSKTGSYACLSRPTQNLAENRVFR